MDSFCHPEQPVQRKIRVEWLGLFLLFGREQTKRRRLIPTGRNQLSSWYVYQFLTVEIYSRERYPFSEMTNSLPSLEQYPFFSFLLRQSLAFCNFSMPYDFKALDIIGVESLETLLFLARKTAVAKNLRT